MNELIEFGETKTIQPNDGLVFNNNGQALTNSLLVAKKFGKEHRNVIRDIKNLLDGGVLKNEQTPMFEETTYIGFYIRR